jgi:3-oxocholest-4-en-26-oate---CoA ligase
VSSGLRTGREPLHFATLWEAIADEIPSARPSPTGPGRSRGGNSSSELPAWPARSGRTASAQVAPSPATSTNCPEYFETFLAALKIRAVPANVNYRYGGAELRALLENCDAEALFFDSALREQVASVRHQVSRVRLLVEVGEADPAIGGEIPSSPPTSRRRPASGSSARIGGSCPAGKSACWPARQLRPSGTM